MHSRRDRFIVAKQLTYEIYISLTLKTCYFLYMLFHILKVDTGEFLKEGYYQKVLEIEKLSELYREKLNKKKKFTIWLLYIPVCFALSLSHMTDSPDPQA